MKYPSPLRVAISVIFLLFISSTVSAQLLGGPMCSGKKTGDTVITKCFDNGQMHCVNCNARCVFPTPPKTGQCDGYVGQCPTGEHDNTVQRCFYTKKECEKALKDANGLCPSDGGGQKICDVPLCGAMAITDQIGTDSEQTY